MSRNAFNAREREYNEREAQREHAQYERDMMREAVITSLQRKDLNEAIDMVESDILRARRLFNAGHFIAAKKEFDDLLQNVRAWDRGQYSPGNSHSDASALIWPEPK